MRSAPDVFIYASDENETLGSCFFFFFLSFLFFFQISPQKRESTEQNKENKERKVTTAATEKRDGGQSKCFTPPRFITCGFFSQRERERER